MGSTNRIFRWNHQCVEYRSDDGGRKWSRIPDNGHVFGQTSGIVLAANPRVDKRIYIGAGEYLKKYRRVASTDSSSVIWLRKLSA